MTEPYDDDIEPYDDVVVPGPSGGYVEPMAEQLLLRLRDVIEGAPKMPLSSSSMIAKEEVLDLLDDAIAALPEELRAARWLLKEREEYLGKVAHEGEEIIAQARDRAERMVQRTEVVKAAEQRAYETVDRAETEARRLRHEVEDYCDQKLASFEIMLERTTAMVASGRAKLQGTNLTAGIPIDDEAGDDEFAAAYADHVDEEFVAVDELAEDELGGGELAHLPPPPAEDEDWDDER